MLNSASQNAIKIVETRMHVARLSRDCFESCDDASPTVKGYKTPIAKPLYSQQERSKNGSHLGCYLKSLERHSSQTGSTRLISRGRTVASSTLWLYARNNAVAGKRVAHDMKQMWLRITKQ